jgi:hypothetical protein
MCSKTELIWLGSETQKYIQENLENLRNGREKFHFHHEKTLKFEKRPPQSVFHRVVKFCISLEFFFLQHLLNEERERDNASLSVKGKIFICSQLSAKRKKKSKENKQENKLF